MSLENFVKNGGFDNSLYQEAKDWHDEEGRRVAPLTYAAAKAREYGLGPEDKELEKRTERYLRRFKIPETPSAAWPEETWRSQKCKQWAEETWYLENYFRHAPQIKHPQGEGIEIFGRITDSAPTMQKAFQVVPAELTVFPFFWDTQIVEGILAVPLLDVLLMDTVTVASGTAVHAVMTETVTDRQMGETGEFASYQEVNITSQESPIKLKKFGGMVTISDEAMRRQRIPVFARGIARIGRQIGIDMTSLMIDILINGDKTYGGINDSLANQSPSQSFAANVSGAPVYADYITVDLNFPIGYEPTDRIFTRSGIIKALQVPEFKDPLSGFKFQSQGSYPEIFGLMTHRWDDNGSSTWNSGAVGTGTSMLVLQRQRALLLYQEGGLTTESDRSALSESTIVKTSWYLIGAVWDRLAANIGTGFA